MYKAQRLVTEIRREVYPGEKRLAPGPDTALSQRAEQDRMLQHTEVLLVGLIRLTPTALGAGNTWMIQAGSRLGTPKNVSVSAGAGTSFVWGRGVAVSSPWKSGECCKGLSRRPTSF